MFGKKRGDAIGVGDRAPDFQLPDQHGTPVRLTELLANGTVVLYFYPKDDSPGCTAEACSFRDAFEVFREAGAQVVGISSDDVERHRRFTDRHRLPYLLLSDGDKTVRKAYGVPATWGLIDGRVTYVIDPEGVVRHLFSSQFRASAHVEEALEVVRKIQEERR
ncbi:MAG: peroxiredoxin [Bradymonadales bacterium]|nr:peroxiredoxin [Bradymonadales bacterium]